MSYNPIPSPHDIIVLPARYGELYTRILHRCQEEWTEEDCTLGKLVSKVIYENQDVEKIDAYVAGAAKDFIAAGWEVQWSQTWLDKSNDTMVRVTIRPGKR